MKNLLIFGDSYSTFAGYIPEGYAAYYSTAEREQTDVRRVEETWWHGLCEDLSLNLVRNDSWSGSTVGNTGYNGDCSKTSSFICRLEKLEAARFFEENPIDTVLIFGCTNDNWANVPLGELKFRDFEQQELFTVRPAIGYFVQRCKEILPEARIVFLINTDLKPEIGDAIEAVCAYNGVSSLRLQNINKRSGHPTIQGMLDIRTQLREFLQDTANKEVAL
jgi:hypothetical protein